jgi:hypothetical protein
MNYCYAEIVIQMEVDGTASTLDPLAHRGAAVFGSAASTAAAQIPSQLPRPVAGQVAFAQGRAGH